MKLKSNSLTRQDIQLILPGWGLRSAIFSPILKSVTKEFIIPDFATTPVRILQSA